MGFGWIEPLYGFDEEIDHVAVPPNAENILIEMVDELVDSNNLVAIYIPEGTEEGYEAGEMRGRVVGGVRLLPMPGGRKIEDYPHYDLDGSVRWPVGWPCEAVYAPPIELCPVLRYEVDFVFQEEAFGAYVARFQNGPFRLERRMAERLGKLFGEFERLA